MADSEKKYIEMSAKLEINMTELLSQFMAQQIAEMIKQAQRRGANDDHK